MPDHFHPVVETPLANLVAGMKWFLGVYTGGSARRGARPRNTRLCDAAFFWRPAISQGVAGADDRATERVAS
jgi:hypothetical protein